MIKTIKDVEEWVSLEGELLKDVKLANNQGIVAHTEKGLQTIMNALRKTGKDYDNEDKFQKDQSDESVQKWKQTRRR